jgi:hypothetical protein
MPSPVNIPASPFSPDSDEDAAAVGDAPSQDERTALPSSAPGEDILELPRQVKPKRRRVWLQEAFKSTVHG